LQITFAGQAGKGRVASGDRKSAPVHIFPIPLDHVGRKRRGLLPEIVERGDELAVEGA
jgi:hypothetical protein